MTLAMLHQLVKYIGLENVENELNVIAAKGFDEMYVELYEDVMERKHELDNSIKGPVFAGSEGMLIFLDLEEAIQQLKDYEYNKQPTKKPTYETESLCFARQRLRALQHKLNEVSQDIKDARSMIKDSGKANDSIQGLLDEATKHSKKAKSNVEAVFSMLNKD